MEQTPPHNRLIFKEMERVFSVTWVIPLINFRDATRGISRTQKTFGHTGRSLDTIKKIWRDDAVDHAKDCKFKNVDYPLMGELMADVKINPAWAYKFDESAIIQYAKYPLDALSKAGIYMDDSQIVAAEYHVSTFLSGAIAVELWQ